MAKKSKSAWGGRFKAPPAERVLRYGESVSFDARLAAHDIRGSLAHAAMLRRVGILTEAELSAIRKGLAVIQSRIEEGRFKWRLDREDVHLNIEAELIALTPAGGKLHSGRSRNDQVATDVRLWFRDEMAAQLAALRALQAALVHLGATNAERLIPGYTHLQRAQPVPLAHHLLAYVEMLDRDAGRIADAARRANVCPLGSGALAGSTLPLDREFVARTLGFVDERGRARVTANSLDAVGDRDFIVEYLAAAALLAVHLSRLAEDLILWSSAEFGFAQIGDAYTTGSSLMPQKKNPDVCELARGKTGRVVGNLVAMLVTLKGLPMAYNRDLQEDKERLFDTSDTVRATLEIFAEMLGTVRFDAAACARAVADPLLLATDVADELVAAGVPFRSAHHLVGAVVRRAEEMGVPFGAVPEAELVKIAPELKPAMAVVRRGVAAQLERRKMPGAPNPRLVAAELRRWRKRLGR